MNDTPLEEIFLDDPGTSPNSIKRMLLLTAGFALLFLALPGTLPAQVPVAGEPYHRPVYQNSMMRLLHVRLAPGDTSLFHRHEHNIFYATIRGARMWLQNGEGESRTVKLSDGWIGDNTTHADRPLVHRIANTGRDTLSLLAVESFLPPRPPDRVVKSDTLISDSVFYGRKHALMPGSETERRFRAGTVLVALRGGGMLERPDGKKLELGGKRLFLVMPNGGSWHIRNQGEVVFKFVEIRLTAALQ